MTHSSTFHDLKGASVFITGGGAGIGAALTEGFVAQGAKVTFEQCSNANSLVAKLSVKYANPFVILPFDFSNITQLKSALQTAAERHGAISILINNTAIDTRHSSENYSLAPFDQNIAMNLRPHFFTAQSVLKDMRTIGGGAIINFSSIPYLMGNAGYPVYAATKSAITGLTRSLAGELGPDNIRVNAVLPGWVMTGRQKDIWVTEDGIKSNLERQCLPAPLVPNDILGTELFLASNVSRTMTGQALVVDVVVVVTG